MTLWHVPFFAYDGSIMTLPANWYWQLSQVKELASQKSVHTLTTLHVEGSDPFHGGSFFMTCSQPLNSSNLMATWPHQLGYTLHYLRTVWLKWWCITYAEPKARQGVNINFLPINNNFNSHLFHTYWQLLHHFKSDGQ